EVERIRRELAGTIRVHVDWSEHRPGWKFSEWELRGVPVRLEIGPKDIAQRQGIAVRRDNRAKEAVPFAALSTRLPQILDDVQRSLYERAVAFRESRTHMVESIDELAAQLERERGFFWAPWCGDAACEAHVKERTGATLRCVPLDGGNRSGACLVCRKDAPQTAVFARAY